MLVYVNFDFAAITIHLFKGDSGSPLTVNGTLAGIVSAGGRQLYSQVTSVKQSLMLSEWISYL